MQWIFSQCHEIDDRCQSKDHNLPKRLAFIPIKQHDEGSFLLSIFFLLSIHPHNAEAFTSVTRGSAKTFVLPVQKSSDNSIPDHDDSMFLSRRNAMRQGATAAMVSLSVATSVLITTPDAALADIYDDKELHIQAKTKNHYYSGVVQLSLSFLAADIQRIQSLRRLCIIIYANARTHSSRPSDIEFL
jgi:hypothetical protein